MTAEESSVSIQNVSKSFGSKEVLRNIELDIEKGEIFGLLGPAGAGKTTLIKGLAGLDRPSEGENYVFGEKMPSLRLLGRIGYMSQTDALYEGLSAGENLKFFSSMYGMKGIHQKERIKEMMELMDLSDHLEEVVRDFSDGMKKRLSLVILLLHKPEMLILDEPTAGIDPVLRKNIWNLLYDLNKEGTTIIITTRLVDEAEKCARIALMQRGKIMAAGTPESLKRETGTENLEQAFLIYGGD